MKLTIKKTLLLFCVCSACLMIGYNSIRRKEYQVTCSWLNDWVDYNFVLAEDKDTVLKLSVSYNQSLQPNKDDYLYKSYFNPVSYRHVYQSHINKHAKWYQTKVGPGDKEMIVNYTIKYDFTSGDFSYEENRDFFEDAGVNMARFYNEEKQCFSFGLFKVYFDSVKQVNCTDIS